MKTQHYFLKPFDLFATRSHKTDAIQGDIMSCRDWWPTRRSVSFLPVCFIALVQVAAAQTNWVPGGLTQPIPIPEDAILAGHEGNLWNPGAPLYVCRGGTVEGYALQPGRFRSDMSGCDIGFDGRDIQVSYFDFLITSWQWASNGYVPSNAVAGGEDIGAPGELGGPSLYYCRARLDNQNDWQPGKIRPGFDGCYIPFGGQEIHASVYEVLVALNPAMPLAKVNASNGYVPPDAIRGGADIDGTVLYICSAVANEGGTHPGKLRHDFGACDISFGGHEEFQANYQVLVPSWLPANQAAFDYPAGYDKDGTPLYVCRGYVGNPRYGFVGSYPGRYRRDWGACHFALNGQEQSSTTFDVLSSHISPPPPR